MVLGLSLEGLARELGVCFSTVNRWERGKSRPGALALASLADACTRRPEGGG